MGWNYRVMKHSSKNMCTGETEIWFGIHEVYYRDADVDDLTVEVNETTYTVEPVRVFSEDIEGLWWTLEKMLEGLDKPILEFAESADQDYSLATYSLNRLHE